MAGLTLESEYSCGVTMVSNQFIDCDMCDANGEFVKIYLYLLRCLSQPPKDFSLLLVADKLNLTENDIIRALKYWEQKGLLTLTLQNGTLQSILFREQRARSAHTAAPPDPAVPDETAAARTPEDYELIKELGLIAEQYIKRPLNSNELDKIVYFYETLHFSPDLIEYLFEHCMTIGNSSFRYIESVAVSWADKNITTVKQAKAEGQHYRREYFTIIKAFGIRNRAPIENEVQYMKKWLDEYHFTTEVICEACQRTIAKTGSPTFSYTDAILKNWKDHGILARKDIAALDHAHYAQANKKQTEAKTVRKERPTSRFNNFDQRDEYDFNQLEKQLNDT